MNHSAESALGRKRTTRLRTETNAAALSGNAANANPPSETVGATALSGARGETESAGAGAAGQARANGSASPRNYALIAAIIAGFGLCRAWIVSCLSVSFFTHTPESSWLFLITGALAALFMAFAAHKAIGKSERFREHAAEATLALLAGSALLMPVAVATHSLLLTLTAFMMGGVAAGLLQILWGERFAVLSDRFVIVASGGGAIVTGVFLAIVPSPFKIAACAVLPLLSFALFVVACSSAGASWRTALPFDLDEAGEAAGANEFAGAWGPAAIAQGNNAFALAAATAGKAGAASGAHLARNATAAGAEAFPTETSPTNASRLDSKAATAAEPSAEAHEFTSITAKLMVSIGVFSFLTRMLDSLPTNGTDPFGALGGSSIFALMVVGAAFLLVALLPKGRFDVTQVYRISVPLMVLGFTALALFFEENSALSLLLVGVGYEFFDVLAWILFAHLARHHQDGAPYIYGMGVACMFAGMALGLLTGDLVHTMVSNGTAQVTVVAFAGIVSLVITGFMVFPESMLAQLAHRKGENKNAAPHAEAAQNSEDDQAAVSETTLEDRCVAAAAQHGLTPREGEILVMLARGRTIAIIARDLQIAKGTARTHTERIYRKLDVHKQQELIDLVEAVEV